MTPTQFVALVEPHLPIGPYEDICACKNDGELHLVRLRKPLSDLCLLPDDAENALLGAIVVESPATNRLIVYRSDPEWADANSTWACEISGIDGNSIASACASTPLEAALLARNAAHAASTKGT